MKKSSILIVDDHLVNLTLLRKTFEREHEVYQAESGEEALEVLETVKPDLIILDVMMPGMDGFEVCDRIKGNPSTFEIPVIFLTALNDKESKINGLKRGAVDFITKPFDIFEVQLRVKQQLRIREMYQIIKRHNEHVRKELQSAQHVQMSLLPTNNQKLGDDYNFSFEYFPSNTLGGDFLDILRINDEKAIFYMADVSGHGVASALVTVYLKLFFQKYPAMDSFTMTASDIISDLNKSFRSINFSEKYLTIFIGVLDIPTGDLNWSFAGPNTIPLIISENEIRSLDSKALPVGWFDDLTWEDFHTKLNKGDMLFLYSDAAIELRDENENMLGAEGLKQILIDLNIWESKEYYSIVNQLLEFSNSINFSDDLTFAIIYRDREKEN